jgi:signal transduction histidine kinase
VTPRERAGSRRLRRPPPSEATPNLLVHELKNLAGRLAILTQNLTEHFDDPLFQRSALAALDDTVVQLRQLAGDVTRREGRLVVKLRVDVNEIVDEALRGTHPELAGRVQLEEAYAALPAIWGDRFLLRRAFACAIENALEAMGGRGTLRVSTGLHTRRGAPRIVVEIADDGPGISPEFLRESLFRPFCSTKADGLGLGVYTLRQVARLHGGTVRIQSEPGAGTRVRFHFPADGE